MSKWNNVYTWTDSVQNSDKYDKFKKIGIAIGIILVLALIGTFVVLGLHSKNDNDSNGYRPESLARVNPSRECADGEYRVGTSCYEKKCECPDGTAPSGVDCPDDGDSHCQACDQGYHLNSYSTACLKNECICPYGYPATGIDCPSHGMNKCDGCYRNLEWVSTGDESYCRRVEFTAVFLEMTDNDGLFSGGLDPCLRVYAGVDTQEICESNVRAKKGHTLKFIWTKNRLFTPNTSNFKEIRAMVYDEDSKPGFNGRNDIYLSMSCPTDGDNTRHLIGEKLCVYTEKNDGQKVLFYFKLVE